MLWLMDKIKLIDLEFMGRHGANPGEQDVPQKFIVNMIFATDTKPAGISDDLSLTVHYGELFLKIKQVMEQEHYQLLEALAERLAAISLADPKIKGVEVEVKKCQAKMGDDIFCSAVFIERRV